MILQSPFKTERAFLLVMLAIFAIALLNRE